MILRTRELQLRGSMLKLLVFAAIALLLLVVVTAVPAEWSLSARVSLLSDKSESTSLSSNDGLHNNHNDQSQARWQLIDLLRNDMQPNSATGSTGKHLLRETKIETRASTSNNSDSDSRRNRRATNSAPPINLESSLAAEGKYRCAKYCSCSLVQVLDRGKSANLTMASCENVNFSDLLTIDRRTQIIHISLPAPSNNNNNNNNNNNMNLPANENDEQNSDLAIKFTQPASFRMPRLVQFSILREIVIINLKFEVCESEVFKRGQKLRRFQLNRNHLSRISKACLKHLEKLIELNLDHNQLEELESALFNSLLNLRSLSIAHNKLSELAAHQFANLTQLVSLNLVGNNFKTINLHLLEPMQSSLRLLVLADNQIKSFVYAPLQQQQQQHQVAAIIRSAQNSSGAALGSRASGASSPFAGALFKNLIKLNVDQNRFERVKSLQLNRFHNVKFLSIRRNLIATIRDKAFNGLKLIELNLAQNKLQSVSKCAFCNATVKRLVLAHNNISMPLPNLLVEAGGGMPQPTAAALQPARPVASSTAAAFKEPQAEQAAQVAQVAPVNLQPLVGAEQTVGGAAPSATSSQSMLILSQSIFGPLFGQLEYLDLSGNEQLANQLDHLLEPLLNLEYLNIAAVGLDRTLPSPNLFKNLRQLRYLNMSRNQLDQVIAETIEPLSQLEVLDMSHNKFSELEETFLLAADELGALRLINLSSNPWFCSQCKVSPLYDWILRSAIYNSTCIAASSAEQQVSSDGLAANPTNDKEISSSSSDGIAYATRPSGRHDYSLLIGDEQEKGAPTIDFDLILGSVMDDDLLGSYNLLGGQLAPTTSGDTGGSTVPSILSTTQHLTMGIRDLAIDEDDESIAQTINAASMLERAGQIRSAEYCLKCEFPGELHDFNLHELSSGDFKFCAGAAIRFVASEPKLGLTLAIVIIGVFLCIIIVVILMYRKRGNTYYTNEDTDHLQTAKKPSLSVSSDVERQYGDGTDYSSPPMSQSFESYTSSQDEGDLDEEDLNDEDEEDEEDEEDDDEEEGDEEEEHGEESERRRGNEDEGGKVHLVDNGGERTPTQVRRMVSAEQGRHKQVADYELRQNSQQSVRSSSGRSSQPTDRNQQQQQQQWSSANNGVSTPAASSAKKEPSARGGASPAKRSQHSVHSNHSLRLSTASAVPASHKPNKADADPHIQVLAGRDPAAAALIADKGAIDHFQHELTSPMPSTSRPPVAGRTKSSQSTGSQTGQLPSRITGSQSVQGTTRRLDSSGSAGSRRLQAASVGGGGGGGKSDEFKADPELKLDAVTLAKQAAQQDESFETSSSARRPGKTARAVYQIATNLRPQSSGGYGGQSASGVETPSAALSTGMVYPNRPGMAARQHQAAALSRLPQAGQLSRQRFAQSKDLSQPAAAIAARNGQMMAAAAVVANRRIANQELKLLPQSSGEDDLEAVNEVLLEEAARRADIASTGRQMGRQQSSPVSDATTADSLAMEAVADFELPGNDELGAIHAGASSFGGALAVAEESSGDDYELDFEHGRPTDEHLLQVFQQTRQPNPSSTHSALTQTGSHDSDML